MPRVLTPRSGASQRFVASPGHEGTGILHMPGGQSGHPLSPHFGDQQRAWVDGVPMPLLPGEAVAHFDIYALSTGPGWDSGLAKNS